MNTGVSMCPWVWACGHVCVCECEWEHVCVVHGI